MYVSVSSVVYNVLYTLRPSDHVHTRDTAHRLPFDVQYALAAFATSDKLSSSYLCALLATVEADYKRTDQPSYNVIISSNILTSYAFRKTYNIMIRYRHKKYNTIIVYG